MKDKKIKLLEELVDLILSKEYLILPKEAFEALPDSERVGFKILEVKQKIDKLQSEIAALNK